MKFLFSTICQEEKAEKKREKEGKNLKRGKNCLELNTTLIDRRIKGVNFGKKDLEKKFTTFNSSHPQFFFCALPAAALVQTLTEKNFPFEVVENPIEKSIIWSFRDSLDTTEFNTIDPQISPYQVIS